MKWQTTTMKGELKDEGLLVIRPQEDFKGPETVDQAQENLDFLYDEIGVEKINATMAYLPKHYINVAATRYYRENSPDVPIAFISNSSFKKMLGNMLLSIGSKTRPTRLFTDEDEALLWLREQINKKEKEESSLSGS